MSERTTGVGRLLDRGQFIPAGAAVWLTRAGAVTWDLNANATSAAFVATAQQGSRFVVRHVNHPYLCLDSRRVPMINSVRAARGVGDHSTTLYPIRVSGK
jgi:hypothetical protein